MADDFNGVLEYLGTIIATEAAAKNQSDTATPFTIGPDSRIVVQPDAATYVALKTASTGAAVAASSLSLAAGSTNIIHTGARLAYLSCLRTSAGTTNVKVFRLL